MALVRAVPIVLIWLGLVAGVAGVVWVSQFAAQVKDTPDISLPLQGHASEIWATDRTRLGGLLRGRRPWVTSAQIPAKVKFAFLAAEDDAFFEHGGFDIIAIARAWLRNRAAGRVVEGGSTITQQVAKRYLGSQKRYERKLTEVFLARRLEASFSKDKILEAYLNEVYLGAGANGVQAAAEIYFNKNLDELTWDEAAVLAGVTSSPSRFNPFRRPERALERRRLVLKRLQALGAFDDAQRQRLEKAPLVLRDDWDGDEDTAPYATVEVRELLKRQFGADVMQHGSYDVTLSLSPHLQRLARRSLDRGLRALDRRQGHRGPLATLNPERWAEFGQASAEVYGAPPEGPWDAQPDRPYLAVVTKVSPKAMDIQIAGRAATVEYDGARWASAYFVDTKNNEVELQDLGEQFLPGDVILVEWGTFGVWDVPPGGRRGKEPRQFTGWRVNQSPKVEGIVMSTEIQSGYVRALVGGWDFDRSQYNRAVVGCRQPGSVFKPIVYSGALDRGMTPATLLADTPIKVEKAGGEVWTPKNADNNFSGFLLMRDALARSRNLPSVEVFAHIGAKAASRRAYKLGITTEMAETEALSLGSSCVKPWDMARVYGTFARHGEQMNPRLILTIQRRDGEVVRDLGHFADPSAGSLTRFDRLVRQAEDPPPRVLHEATAYMLLSMLRAVVYAGTAYGATALGVPVAGKTGTTNAFDAWFIGFTRDIVTVVWTGADNNDRPLGRRESGGRIALPIWLEYMKGALKDRAQGPIMGEPPESVEIVRVDRITGMRARDGEPGVDLPFRQGTAPKELAPDRKERAVKRVDRVTIDF